MPSTWSTGRSSSTSSPWRRPRKNWRGGSHSCPVERLSLADWERSFAVNARGHFLVAREAMRILTAQGLGGALVFVATKNVMSPGKDFAAYSAAKAAEAQLAKVLALEGAPHGIRSNIVNPDAVFQDSKLWSEDVRRERAAAQGIGVEQLEDFYRKRNLLASYVPITSRLRLGTAVYLLALRPPAIAAKITATLDVLSGGRLIFGVGVGGENPKEFEVCGVPHAERGARVTEAIDAVRTLWRDTPATFKGRFTSFAGVSIDPKPVQKSGPPIWIGGRSDAALARAGRQGDGWVSYVVQPERYAQSLDKIRAAAAAARPKLESFAAAHLAFVTVGRDYESAKAVWAEALTRRYAQDFEPLARKYGIIGTPEQCGEAIERFRAAGCNYVILNPIGPATQEREQVERLAAEVMPRLARG